MNQLRDRRQSVSFNRESLAECD